MGEKTQKAAVRSDSKNGQATSYEPTTETRDLSDVTEAYAGEHHPEHFHVVVKQDRTIQAVPAGGAASFSLPIEKVHVLFADAIEFQNYLVTLPDGVEPSRIEDANETKTIHKLRSEGNSEWAEPWAVEVTFEEKPNDQISPTDLRYGGIAKHVSLGEAIKGGVENDEEVLRKLV